MSTEGLLGVEVPEATAESDLPTDDALLGVPIREFLQVRALRGLVLVLIAATILLWPNRSGRVLGILVGLALVLYAATTTVELVREPRRRRFLLVLSVGVTSGLAAALVSEPEESLRTATQALGAMLILVALVTVGLVVAGRHAAAWGAAKATALSVAGLLLIGFPETLLVAAVSITAGIAAAVGLIEVFTAPDRTDADADVGARTDAESPERGDVMATAQRSVMRWIQRRPPEAEERAELQAKLFFEGDSSAVRFTRFATLMLFASVIASVGVAVESTAVVIGAMLIAPLMVPLMGTAYGVTMGWLRRTRRCAGIGLVGIGTGIATGAMVGSVVPSTVDVNSNAQVLARIAPTTLDLAIAVAAGAAGAYALTRRDVSDSLPGVAVAISLVPPLTVAGLCWEQGAWSAGNGALLLFLTNAVAILVAGGATFVLVGAAPLHRVSENQERWATVVASVASLAAIVVLLLLLNGASLAQREFARGAVDDVLGSWTDENPDFRVLDSRTVDDDTIVVDLAGPSEPPDLDAMLDQLRQQVDDDVTVRVTWIEQEQVTVGRS